MMNPKNKHNTLKDTLWVLRGPKLLDKIPLPGPFSQSKKCLVFMGLHLYQQHAKTVDAYCDALRNKGFKMLQVVLYPTRDPKTISARQSPDTLHLCLKDVSFTGFPRKEVLEKIQNFKADIFLNLNGEFSYSDMGFALSSKAPYRVSSYQLEYKPYFNILLKSRSEVPLTQYLAEVDAFFKHLI